MTQENVSAVVARLWRVPARRTRSTRLGRPAELDVDRVVTAAVTLAEDVGLAGVTLPKVADALHVTPMSLYRHIGSKDELFVLMEDLGWGPPPRFEISRGQWRVGLEHWALAQRSLLQQHPWLAQVPISGPPRGPNLIGWMDAGLRMLRDTDLGWAAKIGVLTVVSGYVRHTELMAQQLAAGRKGRGSETVEAEYGRELALLVDPARCPDAAELFGSAVFEPAGTELAQRLDDDFGFGLTLIVDGLAMNVGTGSHSAVKRRPLQP